METIESKVILTWDQRKVVTELNYAPHHKDVLGSNDNFTHS
jgi:hypothetical protein